MADLVFHWFKCLPGEQVVWSYWWRLVDSFLYLFFFHFIFFFFFFHFLPGHDGHAYFTWLQPILVVIHVRFTVFCWIFLFFFLPLSCCCFFFVSFFLWECLKIGQEVNEYSVHAHSRVFLPFYIVTNPRYSNSFDEHSDINTWIFEFLILFILFCLWNVMIKNVFFYCLKISSGHVSTE